MGIPFKKILISFFFLFPVIGITVLAETITVHSSAEFSTAMHQLDTSGLNSDISIQSENSDFEQCRLIVITDNELDTYNAENAIYDSDNMYVLFYDSPQAAEEAYKFYINNDEIDVIPDITMTTEDYGSNILSERETTHLSWGADYIHSDDMNTYLEATFGSVENIPEVKVAVIDSGVDYTHPFFSGRIDTEDGYDYVNNDNDPMDDHSHGTHVSGIICDNTLSNVKIIPYKTLNKNGSGSLSNMLYAMKEADRCGANVINLSLASPTSKMTITASTKSLFKRIIDTDNIVVVAVTGNISASFPQGQSFPACIDGVLGVGSCDSNGVISSTSNYYDDMVDLVAPGVKIYSTVTNGEYAYKSGTSMACPFVSSAAAILKSCDEDYTPAQIEQMLEATAIDRGTVGYDSLYGNGIVNLRLLYSKYYSPLEYTDPLEDINYYNNRISYKYMYSGLSATVIIAGYSNGQLKKSVIDRLNKQANVSVDFNMDNYDTVKIMVWSDLNALRPFTQAYKLK